MEALDKYVERAEECAASAADIGGHDEEDVRLEAYWQREAQIQATLAVAAALREIWTMLARNPLEPDTGAFVRVAGHVFTHDEESELA